LQFFILNAQVNKKAWIRNLIEHNWTWIQGT
jgi:hypothetical protein